MNGQKSDGFNFRSLSVGRKRYGYGVVGDVRVMELKKIVLVLLFLEEK